jgi:hypothetical protein
VSVLLPGPVPVMAADATNSVAASAAAPPVLLCLSAGKPVLIDVASGKPAERQITTGSIQKDGKFKADATLPGIGELTAPISYYKGTLAFVAIQGDIAATPMYNDSRYHNMGSGSVNVMKPIGESVPKAAAGPQPVARLEKPVRVDGSVAPDEWGKATFALSGPVDIFPTAQRAQGGADGATTWISYDDLGAKVYLGCDSNSLYVAAVVTDDRHFNSNTGEGVFNGDVMQVGIAAPKNVHWNLGLALTPDGVVFHQAEGSTNSLSRVAGYAVTRSESAKSTTCELRLPLAALGLEPGAEFGFNVVFLDDDTGNGARYWLQLGPGLAGRDSKTAPPSKLYPRFILAK